VEYGSYATKFGLNNYFMRNIRLIARLDVKAPNLVKGIQMEGLRKMGDPNEFACRYYQQGIDEIFYADIVASLYERNSLLDIIKRTTQDIFVPITVGGGLRSINDVTAALHAGADKVAINTAAIKTPDLITKLARRFGSQCILLSIQAKRNANNWEAYYDNGREHSGLDAIEWAKKGQELGAGEILLTSVDREGTAKGFDINLVKAVTDVVSIPVIASGGMGELDDLKAVANEGHADAIAMAHVLHYCHYTVSEIRDYCIDAKLPVRKVGNTVGESTR
jgi:imidazole glycerol-phosphate synthase subunit HisF